MASLDVKDLLLAPKLEPAQVASLLSPYGFRDTERADANLQAMADEPRARLLLAEILEELLSGLSQSAEPDQGLDRFERFAKAAVNKINLFSYLKDVPRTIELLAKTFGGSPFLSEILIRDPTYFYWVSDLRILHEGRKKTALLQDLSDALRHLKTEEKKLDVLRLFKRKEILRIGIRDLLRVSTVEQTLDSLSDLAEALIQKSYEICDASLQQQYGTPSHRDASGKKVRTAFTVLGMGKLGGGELNFSSDVDLIYLYASDDGKTSGSRSARSSHGLENREYFRRLSQKLTTALSEMTNEGYVYRVDLRLRPEGRAGDIACSLKGFRHYYATRGETWERLALIKAWPVAGDRSLGKKFLSMVRPFIYRRPFEFKALEEVGRIKERIDRKIAARGQTDHHVKLGFGGIREIEWVVQALQIFFGGKIPHIRERNTLKALKALHRQKLLSSEEHRLLSEAYIFMRDVENKLQMVYDFQIHSLPTTPQELQACALRLGYRDKEGTSAADLFLKDYRHHTSLVNRLFQSLFDTPRKSRILKAALSR
jgi:glutamate-ammonia-ligase adenylyltransferase